MGAEPSLSEGQLLDFWARPGFDVATDAWLVEMDRRLTGYAQVYYADSEHLSAFAIVHPEHTSRGLGSALARLIEVRAQEKATKGFLWLHSAVSPGDESAARLLEARGYTWARRFWHMEVDLSTWSEGEESLPRNIHLRPVAGKTDIREVHAVLEDALRDHWAYAPTPYKEYVQGARRQEGFDLSLWILALDGEDPVGVLTATTHPDRGWIEELGVRRSHRGRGIATALLRASFAEFRRRRVPAVRVSVDSENGSGAVSVYEHSGMRVVTSFDFWSRNLADAAPG